MSDLANMAVCAIRYCLARHTYSVAEGVAWAREYGRDASVRRVIISDIRLTIRLEDWTGYPEDREAWRAVLAELEAMDAPPPERAP